jgi:hypothetical protein
MSMPTAPKAFRWARILTGVAVIRVIGLILISGQQSGAIPTYYAYTFASGDLLVGITAIPLAWALGRGGLRTYGLAVAWAVAGELDLLYAFAIASQATGLFSSLSSFLGVGLIILPIGLILQLAILALLLTPSVPRHMARSSTA